MKIALVACAKQKLTEPAPARDLYTSRLFQASRAYAERHADVWFILSAFHELVKPAQIVHPYERTLNDMRVREREAWAARVWAALAPAVQHGDEVIVLAGRVYREDLAWRLERKGAIVRVPLEGMGIGQQVQWLNGALRAAQFEQEALR